MTDNAQFLELLNSQIDSKLQFVDYAESKINKQLEKKEQPETQHFAINKALLALEEEQTKATYTALLNLLVIQLDAYLALSQEKFAGVFRTEMTNTKNELVSLITQVAECVELK